MIQAFKEELTEELNQILADLGLAGIRLVIIPTENLAHGDYTTNAALVSAKELNKNPRDLADLIKEKIKTVNLPAIDRVKIAGPGFINFFLKPEILIDNLRTILAAGDRYGQNRHLAGQKTMIEFTDPNPFKEFHIGHLMTNVIGEALSRIIEANGATVKRVNYQGDVGLHVAKTIWGLGRTGGQPSKIGDLAKAYAIGHQAFEADELVKKKITELNKKIYNRSDEAINKIYDAGRQASLDYFAGIYRRLDTHFDFNFFESATGEFGKEVVLEFLNKNVFVKSAGAVIFPGAKYGLHTRVFITNQGLPTYEAKELGLAKIKYDHYPYDLSLIITGHEINDYFVVLLEAMKAVFPDLAEKTKHISHGLLRLKTGKMSSRTGEVISAEWLIEKMKNLVRAKMEPNNQISANREKISELVALGAIKYSILKQNIGKDIIFDFDQSISLVGRSGPYLQYMQARICSILARAGKTSRLKFSEAEKPDQLERLLVRFPEIVTRAGRELAPQHIATYLFELASIFSAYYAREKIIGSKHQEYRLALVSAVGQTLKNGLALLGIKAPERM